MIGSTTLLYKSYHKSKRYFHVLFHFMKFRHKARLTTTPCVNYCGPVVHRCVDFSKEGTPEYPEENRPSTGEINRKKKV